MKQEEIFKILDEKLTEEENIGLDIYISNTIVKELEKQENKLTKKSIIILLITNLIYFAILIYYRIL